MAPMTRRLGAAGVASMVVALVLTVAGRAPGRQRRGSRSDERRRSRSSSPGCTPARARAQSRTYRLGRDARVVSVTVGHDAGATWTALLCRQGTCADVLAMRAGHDLAAGDYDLRVGVTATSLLPGDVSSIEGRLSFVEAGTGNLAQTGSDPWPVSLAALAMTALGLLRRAGARTPPRATTTGPRRPNRPATTSNGPRTSDTTEGPTSWTEHHERGSPPHPRTKSRRRRKGAAVRFGLAGLALVGIGAAATSAALDERRLVLRGREQREHRCSTRRPPRRPVRGRPPTPTRRASRSRAPRSRCWSPARRARPRTGSRTAAPRA